jgi:hypothetical protein
MDLPDEAPVSDAASEKIKPSTELIPRLSPRKIDLSPKPAVRQNPASVASAKNSKVRAIPVQPKAQAPTAAVKPHPASMTAPAAKVKVPESPRPSSSLAIPEPSKIRISSALAPDPVRTALAPRAAEASPVRANVANRIAQKPRTVATITEIAPTRPSVAPAAAPKSVAVKSAAPKPALLAQAPSPSVTERIASRPHPAAQPVRAERPMLAPGVAAMKGESPTLLARLPDEPSFVTPGALRLSRPVAPAAKPTGPIRIARAEVQPKPIVGHARMEDETAPSAIPTAPAAHRMALAKPRLGLMMGQDNLDFDVQPFIRDGISIAPLRQIIEHTGGMVMWLPASHEVQAVTGDRHLQVKIGSRNARINSQSVMMDYPAFLKEGRTMVPVRFIQVALDMKAVYDSAKGMVYLYQK